jgi:hypothetical protein
MQENFCILLKQILLLFARIHHRSFSRADYMQCFVNSCIMCDICFEFLPYETGLLYYYVLITLLDLYNI